MTTKKTTTNRAAKAPHAPKPEKPKGNLSAKQTKILIMTAREAYACAQKFGNDDGQSFNDWRHAQVMDEVKQPGISALKQHHYIDVLIRFLILAGRDAEAFALKLKHGKVKDHGAPEDTHNARRQIVHALREAVGYHVMLAETSDEEAQRMAPKFQSARLTILAAGGPIRDPYVFTVASRKAGKMIRSWDELGNKLELHELENVRNTIVNRISAKEGRGSKGNRNKGQTENRRTEMRRRALGTDEPIPPR